MEPQFTIRLSVTDEVITYLQARPYNEVAGLIAAIQSEYKRFIDSQELKTLTPKKTEK